MKKKVTGIMRCYQHPTLSSVLRAQRAQLYFIIGDANGAIGGGR